MKRIKQTGPEKKTRSTRASSQEEGLIFPILVSGFLILGPGAKLPAIFLNDENENDKPGKLDEVELLPKFWSLILARAREGLQGPV